MYLSSLNRRVLLDPGHGWSTQKQCFGRPLMQLKNGEVKNWGMSPPSVFSDSEFKSMYREDFGTIAIAAAVKAELEETLVDEVFMTRSTNNELDAAGYLYGEIGNSIQEPVLSSSKFIPKEKWKPWRWIVEAAAYYNCDTVVSIHTNAGGGTGVTSFYRQKEKTLAEEVAEGVVKHSPLSLRGTRKRRFALLKRAKLGCLVECGFHDNYHDLSILLDPEGVKQIGQGIAEGILHSLRS